MFARWLPDDHPFRSDPAFGPAEVRAADPPAPRANAEARQQGNASDNWAGAKNAHPRLASGINGSCALSFLYLFDLIWDICPDMMHIIKNFFEKLTFKVFNGSRTPRWAAGKNKEPAKGDADFKSKMRAYKDAKATHEREVAKHAMLTFSERDQKEVDKRVKSLVGPANWIKSTMVYLLVFLHVAFIVILKSPFVNKSTSGLSVSQLILHKVDLVLLSGALQNDVRCIKADRCRLVDLPTVLRALRARQHWTAAPARGVRCYDCSPQRHSRRLVRLRPGGTR